MNCGWCRVELGDMVRSDAKFCTKRCRQAAHRFGKGVVVRGRAEREMRFAYADPPYPGNSFLYKDHPDFAGEVDHKELLLRLAGYDGWALSTSARALPQILNVAAGSRSMVRVACWVRGIRQTSSRFPLNAWEPVVFAGGRRLVRCDQPADVLTYSARPRTTDPCRVIGAKPSAFCFWMFDLLGALPGDQFDDLYPGSGGVMRAWECYTSARARDDASTVLPLPRRISGEHRLPDSLCGVL